MKSTTMRIALIVLFVSLSSGLYATDITSYGPISSYDNFKFKISASGTLYKTGSGSSWTVYYSDSSITVTVTKTEGSESGKDCYIIVYEGTSQTVYKHDNDGNSTFTKTIPVDSSKKITVKGYYDDPWPLSDDPDKLLQTRTVEFKKDTSAPNKPTISISPSSWTSESVKLTASTTDTGSGVSHYEYYVHKEGDETVTWTKGSSVSVSSNTTVDFRAIDRVGNPSSTATKTVKNIDLIDPVIKKVAASP